MEIRVYELTDTEFIPKEIILTAAEVVYKEHVRRSGYFIIKMPLSDPKSASLQKSRLVVIDKKFAGIIRDKFRSTAYGVNELTAIGSDLKTFLDHRTIIPQGAFASQSHDKIWFDSVSGDTETCIKHYWERNIGALAAESRRLPFLQIGENLHRGNADDSYQARFDNLGSVTAELAESGNLIVTANVDIPAIDDEIFRFVFDVKEPVYRLETDMEIDVSPVLISPDRLTALTMNSGEEMSGSGNSFYVSRSGSRLDGNSMLARLMTHEGEAEPSGISRVEKQLNVSVAAPEGLQNYLSTLEKRLDWINNRLQSGFLALGEGPALMAERATLPPQISSVKTQIEEYYLSEIEVQGRHTIPDFIPRDWLNATINPTNLIRYKDYNLGDYVTARNREWNAEADVQITEIETQAVNGGVTTTVTLGEGENNPFRRIRRDMNNI